MIQKQLEKTLLIGISLPHQTTNQNNQASADCSKLWTEFMNREIASQLPRKLDDNIYAVYHSYDDDHTHPYSYFIGFKVSPDTIVPDGLDSLCISEGTYLELVAKGKIPDCVAHQWKEIWNGNHERAYTTDFEVYDEKCTDWNSAEVKIYLGVKQASNTLNENPE